MDAPQLVAGYDPIATAPDDCYFDSDAAELAIDFFPRYLTHIKGKHAGKPFELEQWQRDIVATLFGWKRADGTRRYRECYIACPRKNGKTTLCAGLGLFTLICDREPGAEVYVAAVDQKQARILFDLACKMIRRNPKLETRTKINLTEKRIDYPDGDAFFNAIPADADGAQGFNAHCCIVDEVHTQPNRDLYDVLRTSMGSRENPLMLGITTAGFDRETIAYELWSHSRKVRDGVINDWEFLPVIYEAEEEDVWHDSETWYKSNPNLGVSVKVDYLETEAERAKTTPTFENTFKRLHLNVWTENESRWINSDLWEKTHKPLPELDGQACISGMDLASVSDITALVHLFEIRGTHVMLPRFWVPEDTVKNADKRYQRQYQHWVDKGWLIATPGNATDYSFIREQILRDRKRFQIKEIRFDPWNALDLHQQLESKGVRMIQIPQTFAGLTRGVKAVEEMLLAGRLISDGNPVMDWMVACTVVSLDGNGNRKPDRRKSMGENATKGKIDGVVGLVMAADSSKKPPANPYKNRGIATV